MFKKFLQAIIVGVANLGMIALVYYVFGSLAFYVVAFVGVVVYAFYLHTIMEQYKREKGISEKPKKEKKKLFMLKKKEDTKKPIEVLKPNVPKNVVKPKRIKNPPVIKKRIAPTAIDLVKLRDYIKYNLYYTQKEDKIKQKLRESGWLDKQIDEAVNAVKEGNVK